MTKHDMASIHAPHAYSYIHDRYPEIGDSYSDLGFSSKAQLGFSPHVFRDQLWNNSEWYMQALAHSQKLLQAGR